MRVDHLCPRVDNLFVCVHDLICACGPLICACGPLICVCEPLICARGRLDLYVWPARKPVVEAKKTSGDTKKPLVAEKNRW